MSDDERDQHWYLVTPDGNVTEVPGNRNPMAALADAPDGSQVVRSDSIDGARARAQASGSPPHDAVRWMLVQPPDEMAIVVLVVDDSGDDALTAAFTEEGNVPSDRFGGLWGEGPAGALTFLMIELGAGDAGMHREWRIAQTDERLNAALEHVPHLVAVLASEIAGDATSFEAIAPRLQAAIFIQVEHEMRGPLRLTVNSPCKPRSR